MGQALSKPAMRPFLPDDTPILAAIYVACVQELTADDYTEAQRDAWAAEVDDEVAFGKRLAGELTLVATIDNSPVGFASLRAAEHIDMLYIHPGFEGQGIASMLIDALEKLALARGSTQLTVMASDTAASFFTNRGYVPKQRNTVSRSGEWLTNTTMQKTLGEPPAPKGPQ